MKNLFLATTRKLVLFFLFLLLASCALKPIPSEYNMVPPNNEQVELSSLGNGKVLVYNGANWTHTMDNTARLNIWIEDKALGQLRPGEYAVINLDSRKYNFRLLHLDAVKMGSRHVVDVDENTKVIMMKPTITSNKLEVTNELPKRFEEYTFMVNR